MKVEADIAVFPSETKELNEVVILGTEFLVIESLAQV